MNEQLTVLRNIGLTFDFVRQLIDNPEMVDKIKNESTIDFLDKDFIKHEKQEAKEIKNVSYIKVKHTFDFPAIAS